MTRAVLKLVGVCALTVGAMLPAAAYASPGGSGRAPASKLSVARELAPKTDRAPAACPGGDDKKGGTGVA